METTAPEIFAWAGLAVMGLGFGIYLVILFYQGARCGLFNFSFSATRASEGSAIASHETAQVLARTGVGRIVTFLYILGGLMCAGGLAAAYLFSARPA